MVNWNGWCTVILCSKPACVPDESAEAGPETNDDDRYFLDSNNQYIIQPWIDYWLAPVHALLLDCCIYVIVYILYYIHHLNKEEFPCSSSGMSCY